MQVYKFRNCLLNTLERSVLRENQYVEMTTKTLDVLQFLIENAGTVVSKDDILGNVWNGNFVEESNLPVHISKLRRSLDENKDSRFIETVQGIGYRFVAPVQSVSENEWQIACKDSRNLPSDFATANVHSIAVLPLRNESGDPNNEYLTDGLTEGLINSLSHIASLKVIARNTVFRFKNKNVDMSEVGDTLGVTRILTGRVRILGDNLAIGVELINADDSTQIWGGNYQRNVADLIAVLEEIAFAVAENLSSSTRLHRSKLFDNSLTRHPESYRLYLKGRYLLEKHSADDMYKALDFFKKSMALDSENIHSYTEIVECYRALYAYDYISYKEFLGVTKPLLAAASEGNQSIDVVQVMYCDLKMLEWKFDEAAKYCRQALAINPNCLKGRLRHSDLLLQSRNFTAALEQLERIMIIDPLSALIYKRIGRLFYLMGEHRNAIAYLNDALDLEPQSYEALSLRGAAYTEIGNYEEALRDFKESLCAENHLETLAMTGVVYAKQGESAKAHRVLRDLKGESSVRLVHSIILAYIYVALEKKKETYECLERAYAQHEPDLRALTYDPRWIPLRREARFKALVKRVGLPNLKD